MRILVIEDFTPLANAIRDGLTEQGYAVDVVADGRDGLTHMLTQEHDMVILDLMLPGLDGMQVLTNARQRGCTAPVLILTARDTVEDRVAGLDRGADDYLPKPFAMEELYARVRAHVRRKYHKPPVLEVGHVRIDTSDHTVTVAGEPVQLSAREYSLLEYLVMRQGELVTRAEIGDHLYAEDAQVTSNVIDVYIGYLRRHLERDGHPKLIHTRRGAGYVFGVRDD